MCANASLNLHGIAKTTGFLRMKKNHPSAQGLKLVLKFFEANIYMP